MAPPYRELPVNQSTELIDKAKLAAFSTLLSWIEWQDVFGFYVSSVIHWCTFMTNCISRW